MEKAEYGLALKVPDDWREAPPDLRISTWEVARFAGSGAGAPSCIVVPNPAKSGHDARAAAGSARRLPEVAGCRDVLLTDAAAGARLYALPGPRVFPEGVAFDSTSGTFFTGSSADGTLFRDDVVSGGVTVFSAVARDGWATVLGMEVDSARRRPWVAGGAAQRITPCAAPLSITRPAGPMHFRAATSFIPPPSGRRAG